MARTKGDTKAHKAKALSKRQQLLQAKKASKALVVSNVNLEIQQQYPPMEATSSTTPVIAQLSDYPEAGSHPTELRRDVFYENHVKGPKCFEDIRTVDENVYPTFIEACYKLGLIGDDREYIDAIKQAADWGSGFYLRNLFSTLLQSGTLCMPTTVWEETWQLLSDDILYRQRKLLKNPAHSRLSIPFNVNEDSTCSRIKPGSYLTELLIRAKLIIWDEAPMTHKQSFEAVDKSLKDVMSVVNARNVELPFGAKVLRLTKNMSLQGERTSDNVDDIRKFSEWISEIGDGLAGGENDGEVDLQFPDDLLIQHVADPIASIVNVTYPDLQNQLWNPDYLQERAILGPTHEIVEAVNDYVLSKIDEEEVIFLSTDEVSNDDRGIGDPDLHST
ncbi:uncharacterized protein LOC141637236 [Silene latifolia]|uniref:uncharacterized protein LOC141637236 n=1 Tax=Silene latifolia TaxID=37657 RepID=UPI003D773DDC